MKEWDVDRRFTNWERRRVNNRQAEFEKNQPTATQLGFKDIDELAEAAVERMSGRVGGNNSHRPNLLNEEALPKKK